MKQIQDILVIDDEPMVTRVVVKVCAAEGMTATAANHANEALHCLDEGEFRLVLCDIMMPELNGFQFLLCTVDISSSRRLCRSAFSSGVWKEKGDHSMT